MKIELMRRLDYWVGIPLCFLLDIINRILTPFNFTRKKASQRKILLIELSEMGGIILTLPLMKKLIKRYSKESIFFLTFKKNLDIFEPLNILTPNNILSLRENSLLFFLLDIIRAIKMMRDERVDTIIDLEFFSRFTAILSYLIGAKNRIGFYKYSFEGLYRGNLLTHNVQYNPSLHISKMYLALADVIELNEKSTPVLEQKIRDDELVITKVELSLEHKERIQNRLERLGINKDYNLFLLNLGDGNLPLREWPLENFIKLSMKLLEDEENYIVIIGINDAEMKTLKFINTVNNKRCINLVGKTNIYELLGLFEISTAIIINDCGLAHLASLSVIKKIVLFGPESPHLFKPLGDNTCIMYADLPCSPCFSAYNHRRSRCKDNKCLKLITPEEVYSQIRIN